MINEEVRHIIEPELRPNERLIWVDRPASFPMNFTGVFLLTFSAFWCFIVLSIGVFANGGEEVVPETGEASPFLFWFVFVSLFLSLGLFQAFSGLKMVIGPSKQVYAITSERVIILDRFFSSRVASFRPDQLSQIEREGNDIKGDLTFWSTPSNLSYASGPWKTPLNKFHKIRHPRDVENLIHQTFSDKGTHS